MDNFKKNLVVVFAGSSVVNFFNLLYQLLIAHSLDAANFAAFNSLLSVFMMISTPLGTLQIALAKYCAEFNAQNLVLKIKFLLSDLLKKAFFPAAATLALFWIFSGPLMSALKIPSVYAGYILSALLALSWVAPVFSGVAQGLELFNWFSGAAVISSVLKLLLAAIFIKLGFSIAGALGALLFASLSGMLVLFFPLKRYIGFKAARQEINYKPILLFLFPVAISNFCFITLASIDMVMVKHYFSQNDAGLYALAQMAGKIFLFFPGAISLVMFPRASGMNARNMDTSAVLKRSLFYAAILCVFSAAFYNIFPSFVLRVFTGKAPLESVGLGRLFSVSMSFFALLNILVMYLLSVHDLRFIKYLFSLTALQCLAIALRHSSLAQVQVILCLNAVLLFFVHLKLALERNNA